MFKGKKVQKISGPSGGTGLQKFKILEYDITMDPLPDRHYKKLPDHIKHKIDNLYYMVLKKLDTKTISELEDLISKYPNFPRLYNYLSIAYSRSGNQEKHKEIIEKNYQLNPDYLFARLNYAEYCNQKGDHKKIAEIFDHKFDLKLLYPKRKKFHISEVANFMALIGIYFSKMGERETAETYYNILAEIADDYPMTQKLHRQLYPGFFRRIFRNMLGKH